MKQLLSISYLLLAFITFAQSKRIFKSVTIDGKKVNYAIQLPEGFDASKTYPVAIGPSEVNGEDDQSYYWRGIKDTRGWILIDYQLYNATGRSNQVEAFLDFIRSEYKVEGEKFHTVCFSANSASIFNLVMKIPENFHSITGVAGNPSTRNASDLKNLDGVKVRFIVGDKDTYWMNAAKDRHARLIEAGMDSKISIIENGKHVLTEYVGKKMIQHFETLR
ncbi:MAG: hypothetical protein Tsb0034_11200 [Ekhidna sp.]